ncbi:hypothetical protein ACS0TY_020910 [Phlomoides rotata]
MGLGMIIHDDSGEFVSCRSLVIPCAFRVEEGEVMGLLEALSWIKQLGLHKVKIEMDVKLVVDAMKATREASSIFNDFIRVCKREMINFSFITFDYVTRTTNEKTYHIARVSRTFSSPHVRIEQSSCVVGLSNGICIC